MIYFSKLLIILNSLYRHVLLTQNYYCSESLIRKVYLAFIEDFSYNVASRKQETEKETVRQTDETDFSLVCMHFTTLTNVQIYVHYVCFSPKSVFFLIQTEHLVL